MASSDRKASPLKARPNSRKPEENPPEKKTDKEEKKRAWWNEGEEDGREEDNKIKLADLPRFQPAVDRQGFPPLRRLPRLTVFGSQKGE